jgi:predicted anti-sigma-YlaC factor YlaD
MGVPLLRLTCKQAHRMVAESMDRELKALDDVRVRLHLRRCVACSEFARQMLLMRSAMRRLGK